MAGAEQQCLEVTHLLGPTRSQRADLRRLDSITQELEVYLDTAIISQSLQHPDEGTDGAVVQEDQVVVADKLLQRTSLTSH